MMFIKLLLIFIIVPLVELAILLKVGSYIGLLPTLGVVILTGILGAALARQQGFMILNRIRTDIGSGRVPAHEIIDGFLILIGGIVLLTPGFLTDLFGFLLLIPLTRGFFKRVAKDQFQKYADYKTTLTIE